MRCILAVAIAITVTALPVQGRIAPTAVKVPLATSSFSSYVSNDNSVSGFSSNMNVTYDLSTAQNNGVCYGRSTSGGNNDCITLIYDLGAIYNIRSVVTYLPLTDRYSGGLFSSVVTTRFSTSAVSSRFYSFCASVSPGFTCSARVPAVTL
jgi:hypothetical protein